MKKLIAILFGAACVAGTGAAAIAGPTSAQQQAQQHQPSQQPQAQSDNDDSDAAETFAWSTGQSHLGVLVMGMTPELRQHFGAPADRGVLIAKIEPGSPAQQSGVQVGDVIVRVAGTPVRSGDDVIQALSTQRNGHVRLVAIRQGHPVRIDATLPAQSSNDDDNSQI